MKDFLEFANGSRIEHRPDPDFALSTTPTTLVNNVVEKLHAAHPLIETVLADKSLSEIGKAAKVEQHGDTLIAALADASSKLEAMEVGINRAEADFHKPPALAPNDAVGFLQDQERRAYLNGLPDSKRTEVLGEIAAGKHPDLSVALLRSPVPVGFMADIVREAWIERRNAEEPQRAAHLAAGRRSLAWGRRAVAQLQGVVQQTTRVDAQRIKRVTASLSR